MSSGYAMKQIGRSFSDRGQSIVEFALVVPLLLLLLVGIIEFGRLWMTMNVLTGAAREGVRIAAVTAPDEDRVINTVQNYLISANLSGSTITVSGPNASSEVTVTVQLNYDTIFFGFIPGLSSSFQLTRSATMHWES